MSIKVGVFQNKLSSLCSYLCCSSARTWCLGRRKITYEHVLDIIIIIIFRDRLERSVPVLQDRLVVVFTGCVHLCFVCREDGDTSQQRIVPHSVCHIQIKAMHRGYTRQMLRLDSGLMGSAPQMWSVRGTKNKKYRQVGGQADDRGCAPRYDSASSWPVCGW